MGDVGKFAATLANKDDAISARVIAMAPNFGAGDSTSVEVKCPRRGEGLSQRRDMVGPGVPRPNNARVPM